MSFIIWRDYLEEGFFFFLFIIMLFFNYLQMLGKKDLKN
jgi:hypothetical protein